MLKKNKPQCIKPKSGTSTFSHLMKENNHTENFSTNRLTKKENPKEDEEILLKVKISKKAPFIQP